MSIKFDDDKADSLIKDLNLSSAERYIEKIDSSKYGLPYADLSTLLVDIDALGTIPEAEARQAQMAAFRLTGKDLYIGTKEPENKNLIKIIDNLKSKGFNTVLHLVSERSLAKAWSRYKDISLSKKSTRGSLDISPSSLKKIADDIHTMKDIKGVIDKISSTAGAPLITKILEIILAGAIKLKASDIHLEPEESEVMVRYRIDGVLHVVVTLEHNTLIKIIPRIKLLSGMKLTKSVSQDGRFAIVFPEKELSIRSSIIPGAYGESAVMRVLDPDSIDVPLESLGIEKNLLTSLIREIDKPNGMIVITGPTGSGKTTTLYSFLKKIQTPDLKIITIEDPIEYHLSGITQTQVDNEKNYTFLNGLRAALRQDPDVIMLGEIRDKETAQIAINSSLTGHMVFSTLHTNSASGAIPRLIDLGINPKIITSALTVTIAQRLVRKLDETKIKRPVNKEEFEIISKIISDAKEAGKDMNKYGIDISTFNEKFEIYDVDPKEIEKGNIGYKGRIGIYEVIFTDDNIANIIDKNPSEREIREQANAQNMLTMKEDGVLKVLSGITTLEEIRGKVNI